MKKARVSESPVVVIVTEEEAGGAVARLTRTYEISAATYYQWESKHS